MKVLWSVPRDGKIILDPVRLPDIMRGNDGDRKGYANGVLTPDHLVVSTVSCSTHHECAGKAGIELEDIDFLDPVPGKGHLRLQMDETTVEAEFWYEEEIYEKGECPLTAERLAAVADWVSAHPAIVRAFGSVTPAVEITLLHDGARMWKFRDGGIHETPETPRPAGPAL